MTVSNNETPSRLLAAAYLTTCSLRIAAFLYTLALFDAAALTLLDTASSSLSLLDAAFSYLMGFHRDPGH